ncbi:hypothetical protein [Pectobacterium versatile]|uniref:hypothetical protein n=1 Tax=Pectobacterium versatile TaxID=2488639 RepID=UPI0030173399
MGILETLEKLNDIFSIVFYALLLYAALNVRFWGYVQGYLIAVLADYRRDS